MEVRVSGPWTIRSRKWKADFEQFSVTRLECDSTLEGSLNDHRTLIADIELVFSDKGDY